MTILQVAENRRLLNPTSFGEEFSVLFTKTDLSVYDQWLDYSKDNFENDFVRANDQLYENMGIQGWWGAVARDKIVSGHVHQDGTMKLIYISNAKTDRQQTHRISKAPQSGWAIPTVDSPIKDGKWEPFYPGTGVPFATVHYRVTPSMNPFELRRQVEKMFEGTGFPIDHIPYWVRPDVHRGGLGPAVGRLYGPFPWLFSRFVCYADASQNQKLPNVGTFV